MYTWLKKTIKKTHDINDGRQSWMPHLKALTTTEKVLADKTIDTALTFMQWHFWMSNTETIVLLLISLL